MEQQHRREFDARFPYGIGNAVGNVGQLALCTLPEGQQVYAGLIDKETVLIVPVEEYSEAWQKMFPLCGPLSHSNGDFNPNSTESVIGSIEYWLEASNTQ